MYYELLLVGWHKSAGLATVKEKNQKKKQKIIAIWWCVKLAECNYSGNASKVDSQKCNLQHN